MRLARRKLAVAALVLVAAAVSDKDEPLALQRLRRHL